MWRQHIVQTDDRRDRRGDIAGKARRACRLPAEFTVSFPKSEEPGMERSLKLGSTASDRNEEMVLGDFADLKVRSAQHDVRPR